MFGKDALKHKMGKVVNIKISVDHDDKDAEKKTDLAPMVMDSEEPGVVKESMKEDMGQPFADKLVSSMPEHPSSGKTLDSIARERYMKKKGLKG